MIRIVCLLLALSLLATAFGAEEAKPVYKDISIDALQSAITAKTVTVIDVNGSESYAAGHIPSAQDYAVIKDDFAAHLPKSKDSLVVAYCGGPQCNAYKAAAAAAIALGYTNVVHLSAGISGWKTAGQAVEKAE